MPVYKVEPYLKKSVDSIIKQSYTNLEIILVDDGSADNCSNICDEYALNDNRVKVIHKENGGQAEARNYGLDIARGEYLYFIDSDDYAELKAIEYLVDIAEKYDADMVIADINIVDEKGVKIDNNGGQYHFINKSLFTGLEAANMFADLDWGPWNKLYRKKVYENIKFPVGKIHEDEAIMFQLFKNTNKCIYTNEKLYNYVKHPGSTTTCKYSEKKMDWYFVWLDNYYYVINNFPNAKSKVLKKLIITGIYNLNNLLRLGFDDNNRSIVEIISFLKKNIKEIIFNKTININYKLRCIIAVVSLNYYFKIYI